MLEIRLFCRYVRHFFRGTPDRGGRADGRERKTIKFVVFKAICGGDQRDRLTQSHKKAPFGGSIEEGRRGKGEEERDR